MPEEPYRPSNGIEGADFMEAWCGRCKRDSAARAGRPEDGCAIIAATMMLDKDDPGYPKEWVADDGFRNPRCTAFEAEGEPRCDRTMEMPGV